METKTYYARELSTILDQIKQELGEEAIIVKSRRTRAKGVLGLFQKPVYEVVVSFDPQESKNNQSRKAPASNPLSGFGKDADRRLAAAATAAAARAGSARERRVEETLPPVSPDSFAQLISMADALDAQQNTADKIQPAWITPTAKLGAYVSMKQPSSPAAAQQPHDPPRQPGMPPNNNHDQTPNGQTPNGHIHQEQLHQEQLRQEQNARAQLVNERAFTQAQGVRHEAPKATFAPPASVSPTPYMPPDISIAAPQGEKPRENASAQAPAKRKRGRPRKASQPEKQFAAHQEPAPEVNEQGEAIVSRLDVVEQMLRSLMDDMRHGASKNDADETPAEQPSKSPKSAPGHYADEERIRDSLLNQDVDLPVAQELIERASRYSLKSGIRLEQAMERVLKEVLGKPKYLRGSTKTARTVMLIGPTGVGKTTTLVKLAAGCMFERKANVAIINADVFRVGAQDQLKAYAKILDVPLKTIYATKELKDTINEFCERDFIFIDTCGKASSDKEYQNEIKELLNTGKVQDVYLVVSSTTSGRVCRQIVESYAFIKQYKTILTKLDESGSIGGALNLSFYSGQPLSYITIGQNVPDDISKVDVEEVIERLMR